MYVIVHQTIAMHQHLFFAGDDAETPQILLLLSAAGEDSHTVIAP
jgi:hypothetical protein